VAYIKLTPVTADPVLKLKSINTASHPRLLSAASRMAQLIIDQGLQNTASIRTSVIEFSSFFQTA